MTGGVESGSPEEVTIMIVTTAIQFACGFGLIALAVFTGYELFHGHLTMREFAGLPLGFALTALTGAKAMMLVCRPTRAGMVRVAALGLLTLAVVLATIF
ncbi:MAG: hypothetical protein QM690_19220 [Sphingobium sp.]